MNLALFQACAIFGGMKNVEGLVSFLMCMMSGRKVVERTSLNVGALGLRTVRYQVTYHTYPASMGRLSYMPSVERV